MCGMTEHNGKCGAGSDARVRAPCPRGFDIGTKFLGFHIQRTGKCQKTMKSLCVRLKTGCNSTKRRIPLPHAWPTRTELCTADGGCK